MLLENSRAGNRRDIWSITHGPRLSPAHPLAWWFHPSCEVPEPTFGCIPSALVATGSSLQPQVVPLVNQVLVWAVGSWLQDIAGIAAQYDKSSVETGSNKRES